MWQKKTSGMRGCTIDFLLVCGAVSYWVVEWIVIAAGDVSNCRNYDKIQFKVLTLGIAKKLPSCLLQWQTKPPKSRLSGQPRQLASPLLPTSKPQCQQPWQMA